MRFYDAHNHLQDERFGGAQRNIVETAVKAGVARMIVNGSCEGDWPQVAELAKKFPQALPSFGYHPWYLHERTAEWKTRLAEFLDRSPSAIGEIGLDRWKPDLSYEGQEEAFVWQLALGGERNLAVSIRTAARWKWLSRWPGSAPAFPFPAISCMNERRSNARPFALCRLIDCSSRPTRRINFFPIQKIVFLYTTERASR